MKKNTRNFWSSVTAKLGRKSNRRCLFVSKEGKENASEPRKRLGLQKQRLSNMKYRCDIRQHLRPQGRRLANRQVSLLNPIFQTQCQTTYRRGTRRRKSVGQPTKKGGSYDDAGSQKHTSKWLAELPGAAFVTDETGQWPNSNKTDEA